MLSSQDSAQIILQVTEHVQVDDYTQLIESITRFKKAGYRLAVDDAGAGYSSLNHIVQLQPDIIKLDISLTRDIHRDQVRRSLGHALVFFAKETNAEILAEGIETKGEMQTLAELGVDFGQGYFFAKPLDIADAVEIAKANLPMPKAA